MLSNIDEALYSAESFEINGASCIGQTAATLPTHTKLWFS